MRKIVLAVSVTALFLSGCASSDGPEYDGSTYQAIKRYEIGTVEGVRHVVVTDNGTGTFLGALTGAILGSTVGHGNGSTLAALAGGLGGAYVGSEINKANAQELSVKLDNGEHIVVISKGKGFEVGDRVKIIKDGNKVDQVYKLDGN
jgi:outer membrane lipoprotein SlyB